MKLEAKSKRLLSITKSKAKMYEFAIDEHAHIKLDQDPRHLLITTIGILGELSAIEARAADLGANERAKLKSELISVGQYFDALDQTRLDSENSTYLKLVGAAAYYLADMPGSASILSNDLLYKSDILTPTNIEGLLIWILKGDYSNEWYRIEGSHLTNFIDSVGFSLKNYFEFDSEAVSVLDSAELLRVETYKHGTDRELLFVDVILALIRRKLENSSINCLPLYTKIPFSSWHEVVGKQGFIQEFWPAQRLLGERGVLSGASAIVQLPTSAGKTKSTEIIIRSAFISGRASLAVIVAPFRALCREITASFQKVFDNEDININELQDVMDISLSEQVLINLIKQGLEFNAQPKKTIVVSTPEKLVYLLRHEPSIASNMGLLIFDEGHQFDTGGRGVTYELLIASLKMSVKQDSQKILISAVMANAATIGEWLNGEAGIEVQGSHCLPTIRNFAFTSWKTELGQLHYIDQDLVREREYFVPRVIEQINLGVRGKERKDKVFPIRGNNQSVASYLGLKLCHQGPVAIFCGMKSTVTTISKSLLTNYERGLNLPSPRDSSDESELDKIAHLSLLHFGKNHVFTRSIKLGVLPHSANVPNGIRASVEWAMERKKGVMVVCTSTLAQGVNLPIKYLIISSTLQAGKEISTRDFHNLIGRAGRSGYHTEGNIIFANPDIFDGRSNPKKNWRWRQALHLLDFSNAEECISSLLELIKPIEIEGMYIDILQFLSGQEKYKQECIDLAEREFLDVKSLLTQMEAKETVISALESYFLSHLKDRPGSDENTFDDLAKETLAYFTCSDAEKTLLRTAFLAVALNVLKIRPEKYSSYGKSLLGLKQLFIIDNWIDENLFPLELARDSEEILIECWPLLSELMKGDGLSKFKPTGLLLDLAKKWISGESYINMYTYFSKSGAYCEAGKQRRSIKMDHIIDIVDGAFSFNAMLYAGAIADIAEGKGLNEDTIGFLRILQNRLKLGLSRNLEIWLYSRGFVDREVCKLIATKLELDGVYVGDGFDTNIIKAHKDSIKKYIVDLPTYFSEILDA